MSMTHLQRLRDDAVRAIENSDYATAQRLLRAAETYLAITPDISKQEKEIRWRSLGFQNAQHQLNRARASAAGVQVTEINRTCHMSSN